MYIDGLIYIYFMMAMFVGVLLISHGVYSLYEALVARRYERFDLAKLIIEAINAIDRLILFLKDALPRSPKSRSTLDIDVYIMKKLRNNL